MAFITLLLTCTAASVLGLDTCGGNRCDTAACPCGCECGTPTDPGLCFVPKEGAASRTSGPGCNGFERKPTVLITGATGRTGSSLYKQLVAEGNVTVRAFVRDVDKARKVLGCSKCDPSEGVFIGNVSDDAALRAATLGAHAVAIAVGASGSGSQKEIEAVEFIGVQKQAAALAQPSNLAAVGGRAAGLRVVLCSSMGTTDPKPSPMEGGSVLFWKLNAEAYLAASGLSVASVKPCGLLSTPGGQSELLVGKDDALLHTMPPVVSRQDVARVMAAALAYEEPASGAPLNMRFDLCSKKGPATTDLHALLSQTLWPWQQ